MRVQTAEPSAASTAPPRPRLTVREVEILVGWLRADTKEAAATALFISPSTVSTHVARIRAKYAALGRPASTKTQLFVRAVQDGLLDINDW